MPLSSKQKLALLGSISVCFGGKSSTARGTSASHCQKNKRRYYFLLLCLSCSLVSQSFGNKLPPLASPKTHTAASVSKAPEPVLLAKMDVVHLVINQSLTSTLEEAKLPANTLSRLSIAFGGTLNFKTLLKPGDKLSFKYEGLYDNQQKLTSIAKVVAVRIQTAKKTYESVLYPLTPLPKGAKRAYYNRQGQSYQPGFARWPIARGRISSPFSMHRYHPILGITRPHTGVDFAAPYGTPIQATAKGVIIFEGMQGGYGRVVMMKNYNGYVTLYAHMSRFVKGLGKGSVVYQSQVIGYIGTSGLAQGPHVHYEVRENGQFRNPMTVPLPGAQAIPPSETKAFMMCFGKAMQALVAVVRTGDTQKK